MTEYVPFSTEGNTIKICNTCDLDGSIRDKLEQQEARKLSAIGSSYRKKLIEGVYCKGHEEEASSLPWSTIEAILDECQERIEPKESFNYEEWLNAPLRGVHTSIPGIDPRT